MDSREQKEFLKWIHYGLTLGERPYKNMDSCEVPYRQGEEKGLEGGLRANPLHKPPLGEADGAVGV